MFLDVLSEKHKEMSGIDTLIIAESMARHLKVSRAITIPVGPQDGMSEVSYMILSDKLRVDNYKFIVLLFGQVDLSDTMRSFKQHVGDCLQGIRRKNEKATVVLCSCSPFPGDDFRVPGRVGMHNNYMSLLVEEACNLEFGKPGKALICGGKVSGVFFTETGDLNLARLELVRSGLENKFCCGQLRAKFETCPKFGDRSH